MQNFVKSVRFNTTFFGKFYCKVCLKNLNVNIHWENITRNIVPLEYADVQTLFKRNKYDVVQFNFQSSKFLCFKSRFSMMRTLKSVTVEDWWPLYWKFLMLLQIFFKCNKFCSALVLNSVLADLVIRKMGQWQENHAARYTLCIFLESLMKLWVPQSKWDFCCWTIFGSGYYRRWGLKGLAGLGK